VSDELVAGQSPDEATHFKDRERRQNSGSFDRRFTQKIVDVNRLGTDQVQDLRFQRIQDQFSWRMNRHGAGRRGGHRQRPQRAEHIVDASHKGHAIADQVMATFAGETVDLSGQREDFSALLHGMSSCIQGSGIPSGFDHDDAQTEPADNSISLRKQAWERALVDRHFTQQRALLGDFRGQFFVFRGINVADSAGQHGQSSASGLQGSSMSGCIDSASETADDRKPARDNPAESRSAWRRP
jgi:hypothetical protein